MKNLFIAAAFFLWSGLTLQAQPIAIGAKAPAFSLKNIDGSNVSLADYAGEKGLFVIFSCNPCPYAKAYEGRIIKLHQEFAQLGYPVVMINPNDPVQQPDDSFEHMKQRAAEKNYPFPYLQDSDQTVFPAYGATRTPEVFLLKNEGDGSFTVAYTGTIDDNYQDETAVEQQFAASAVKALMAGNQPDPATTRAIGCGIKVRK